MITRFQVLLYFQSTNGVQTAEQCNVKIAFGFEFEHLLAKKLVHFTISLFWYVQKSQQYKKDDLAKSFLLMVQKRSISCINAGVAVLFESFNLKM